jgi:hypothetical protein
VLPVFTDAAAADEYAAAAGRGSGADLSDRRGHELGPYEFLEILRAVRPDRVAHAGFDLYPRGDVVRGFFCPIRDVIAALGGEDAGAGTRPGGEGC